MAITIKSRQVGIQPLSAPEQQRDIQAGAPVTQALQTIGQTVSELGKIGAQMQQIDAKEQARLDDIAARETFRKQKADSTNHATLIKGSLNEQSIQYKKRKLHQTSGLAAEGDAYSDRLIKEVIGKIQDPVTKELLLTDIQPSLQNFRESNLKYESEETHKGNIAASESSILNSTQGAIIDFENPLTYMIERANIEDQVDELADLNGWDEETKRLNLNKYLSDLEEGRIRKFSFKDAKVAKELYVINKSLFDIKKQSELEGIIDKDDTQQFAQSAVDALELIPRDEWDDAIKKIKYTGTDAEKAKKREAVEKRAKSRGEYLDNQAAAEKKKELNDALMSLYREPDRTKRERMAYALNDTDQIEKALKASDSIESRKKRDVETDFKVWAEVKDRIHAGEFKNTTELLEFFPSFSASDFKVLSNELDAYLNEQKSGKKADDGAIKHSTLKDAFSVALGVKYDVEDSDQMRDFRYAYDKLKEKNITDFGEAKDEIRKLILDGEIFGGEKFQLWEPDMTRAEAEATGQLDKWMPDILDDKVDLGAERQSIINALSQDGITDPGDTLMRLYKKDSILKLPLSDGQKALYRRLWKQSRSKK